VLIDVRGDVDTVDRDVLDERVDIDVHEPRVRDRDVGHVHVAKARPTEIDTPEDGAAEVLILELLCHCASVARTVIGRKGP
jgi:hypothetical protein